MGNGTIISPVIMEENMNSERYLAMISNIVVPQLLANVRYQENKNGSITRVWWFKDKAPCHWARIVHDRLQILFRERIVGIGHYREFPACSPDLTPLDFYVWGFVKSKVNLTLPGSLDELERIIRNEVQALRRSRVPHRAVAAMWTKAERCLDVGGWHVEGRGL